MGRLLYERPGMEKRDALAFVARRAFRGVILSGTKSPEHLEENWHAFAQATHIRG
jgi:aryl-alcohol dehydrogenase-like predicted oxidoreductase